MSTSSPWKNILVATDFSECSRSAVARAQEMFQGAEVRLTLITAVEPATHGLRIQTDDVHERMEAEAKGALKKLSTEVFGDDARVMTRVVPATPADAICETATNTSADLVIVGSHGATGLKRYLLGSVAEKVVRHAPCSVLVVR